MKAPSPRWIAVARVYNRLLREAKAEAQKRRPKRLRFHISREEAKLLKALFRPDSPSYKRLNSKQRSSSDKPFLVLGSEQALSLATSIRQHLEGGLNAG